MNDSRFQPIETTCMVCKDEILSEGYCTLVCFRKAPAKACCHLGHFECLYKSLQNDQRLLRQSTEPSTLPACPTCRQRVIGLVPLQSNGVEYFSDVKPGYSYVKVTPFPDHGDLRILLEEDVRQDIVILRQLYRNDLEPGGIINENPALPVVFPKIEKFQCSKCEKFFRLRIEVKKHFEQEHEINGIFGNFNEE